MQNKLEKLEEFTRIKDKLPDNISYNIIHVDEGKMKLLESSNKLNEIILEEIIKLNH